MTWKGDNFSFQDRYKKICWIILRVSCQKHHSKTALHAPKVLFSEQIILQPSSKTVQSIFHLLLRQDCVDRHKRNIWVNQNKVLSVIAFPAWLFNISCTKKLCVGLCRVQPNLPELKLSTRECPPPSTSFPFTESHALHACLREKNVQVSHEVFFSSADSQTMGNHHLSYSIYQSCFQTTSHTIWKLEFECYVNSYIIQRKTRNGLF